MIKIIFTVILLFFLTAPEQSFAQNDSGGIKIYSGFLHHGVKTEGSFWHSLFGPKPPKQPELDQDRQCYIEFNSPIPFSHLSVAQVPESLSYFIRFIKSPSAIPVVNTPKQKDPFEKFLIKIYTNDDQEYSVDPAAGDKIFDPYIIYLILGSDIDHLEIVSTLKDNEDKYILDKVEVHNAG